MDKQWILVALVPMLFAAGIIAFFVFLPRELISLPNLIAYMSSLSTSIMVLVYIFTMSRQLDTMHSQLKEMQYSRGVQIQPMPYLEKPKATLDLPRFYVGPETDFKKMELLCMLHVGFSVSNIGNGPAVAIDFLPSVLSGPPGEKPSLLIKETLCNPIDCVPSGDRDPQVIKFHFNDDEHKAVEALVEDRRLLFCCTLVFRNALGTAFLEEIAFWLNIQSENDLKTLQSALKTTKTANIDFENQIKQYRELKDAGRKEEAQKVLDDANAKLGKGFGGKKQIDLSVGIAYGSFEVSPISQSKYKELLGKKYELEKKAREEIEACWRKGRE